MDQPSREVSSKSVRLLPADVLIAVDPGESIVEAVRRHGYRTRYSCRRGGCGACKADLLAGELTYPQPIAESVLSPVERAAGKCLPCRAQPDGHVVVRLAAGDRLRRPLSALTSDQQP